MKAQELIHDTRVESAPASAFDRPAWVQRGDRNLIVLSLVLIVTIRFFTEVRPVLPRAANFIDVPLFVILFFRYALTPRAPRGTRRWFSLAAGLFIAVWLLSSLVNTGRVAVGPGVLFLYGFLGPIAFYFLVYEMWPRNSLKMLSSTIFLLGLVQFAVVLLIDLPLFFADPNPDVISGTFGENAYQLVYFLFLFVTLLIGMTVFEPGRRPSRVAVPLIFASFIVIFLAQFRALLITALLVVILTVMLVYRGVRLGQRDGRPLSLSRATALSVLAIASSILAFSFVATRFPVTKFLPTIESLRQDPAVVVSGGKVQAIENIWHLYTDNPRYILTGTGPGTYSSRAWRTFALEGGGHSDVAGSYVRALTGGVLYNTDVSDRYVRPMWLNPEVVLGSYLLSLPFSSYLALLAEVGVPGFLLLMVIYMKALFLCGRMSVRTMRFADKGDPLPALLLAGTIGIFALLQMTIFDNWLEVARVTIPTWVLIAAATKEYRLRAATA